MRILFVTSQWPTESKPYYAPFVRTRVENLRKAGAEVDVFHYKGFWNPANYLGAMISLRRQLKGQNYHLVSAHFGQCGLVAVSQNRLPVVVSFGGSDLIGWVDAKGREPLASKLLRSISRFAAARAAQVIIPGEHMASYLPRIDYFVIPSGLDLDLFRPMDQQECRQRLGLPLDKRLVLFAADPRRVIKRFDLAQKAVEIAGNQLPSELIVAATAPHAMMPIYMNACDALLLTSQHEGSPNVVKEALACNLPVVSVDVGDVRARLGTASNCWVCETDDPEEIARALVWILEQEKDPGLRDLVLELNSQNIATKELEVYQKAIMMESNGKR